MLRYLTAGESHGPALVAVIEGLPAGLRLAAADIDRDLIRRQGGYGRGGRMKIEQDRVQFLAGVRLGRTIGSPVCLQVSNRDWEHWRHLMGADPPPELTDDESAAGTGPVPPGGKGVVTQPRPGHADLAGGMKYGHRDLRNVLERASARETTVRVAVGAVCKRLLAEFDIQVLSHVVLLGGIEAKTAGLSLALIRERAEASPVRCADEDAAARMISRIDEAKAAGDTLGGVFEVVVTGVPVGLGSYVQWDRKLDGRLGQALLSIQAIKGVEIGLGFAAARLPGSEVHDEIFYDPPPAGQETSRTGGFWRGSNRAGGLEGGTTNGQPIVVRAAMKPISTLYKPLRSVDIETKEPVKATVQRSDVCALPAAAVIGEAVVAFEVARAFLEKFGGDSMQEIRRNFEAYCRYLREY